MEKTELITFSREDIIEALQDFYENKYDEKIDINFNEDNLNNLREIIIKNSISFKGKAELLSFEPELGVKFNNNNTLNPNTVYWEEPIQSTLKKGFFKSVFDALNSKRLFTKQKNNNYTGIPSITRSISTRSISNKTIK